MEMETKNETAGERFLCWYFTINKINWPHHFAALRSTWHPCSAQQTASSHHPSANCFKASAVWWCTIVVGWTRTCKILNIQTMWRISFCIFNKINLVHLFRCLQVVAWWHGVCNYLFWPPSLVTPCIVHGLCHNFLSKICCINILRRK